jgi:hypothetical protein
MKRQLALLLGLFGASCAGDGTSPPDSALQSEIVVAYVSQDALPVTYLSVYLQNGDWTRALPASQFAPHPNSLTGFNSGFIQIPGQGLLTLRVVLSAPDTLLLAELQFPMQPLYSYRFSLYPTRQSPDSHGGDVAIPLLRRQPGFPGDSLYYRWAGYSIRPFE